MNKIFGIIGFIVLIFLHFLLSEFKVPLLGEINADIRVNLAGDGSVFANGKIVLLEEFNGNKFKTAVINSIPVYDLVIHTEKQTEAFVSVGDKLFHLDNIKGDVSFDKKYSRTSKYINDKGVLKRLQVCVLSFFYSTKALLFFGFLVCCLYLRNPNYKKWFLWILSFGLLFRLADISPYFWADETYACYLAGNYKLPFMTTFIDPGNPPLFFILLRFWEMIFGHNEAYLRLLPIIFSTLSIFVIFEFCKKYLDKKTALLSSFLFSINLYAILFAQELRSYSLCILLTVLISFYSIKIIRKNSGYFLYTILGILAINTHYYLSIILFSNFIFVISLCKNKLKFLISNLIIGLSFLPYLLITGLNKGLKDETFNSFQLRDFSFYKNLFVNLSCGKLTSIILILFFIICIFNLIKKKDENGFNKIYFYCFYMIISTFVFVRLFSLIKSIEQEHYFICLLPFFIILISFIFLIKNKYLKILLSLGLLFSYFGHSEYLNRNRENLLNFDNIVQFYLMDKKDENSILILPYSKDVILNQYELNEDKILVHNLPQKADNLIEIINQSKEKEFYFKIYYKEFLNIVTKMPKNYELSFIRTNKDAIIARVKKDKR